MTFTPSRRDMLKGGAAAAAGAWAMPHSLVRALAATQPACGSLSDIEHVIIFIQENHSFDNYFGRYPGVRGSTTAASA